MSYEIGRSASMSRTITAGDIEAFARLSGDTNPVHLDEAYAATTRFGRRVAHGLLSAGLFSAIFGTKYPGVGAIYMQQNCRFLKPVFIGDVVTATCTVTAYREDKKIVTFATVCVNQDGEKVIDGEAVLWVGAVKEAAEPIATVSN